MYYIYRDIEELGYYMCCLEMTVDLEERRTQNKSSSLPSHDLKKAVKTKNWSSLKNL